MSSLAKISISFLDRFLLQNVCRSAFLLQQRSLRSRPIDDLPEKPKRPPSVWLLFLAERRNELHEQAEYESVSLMQMSKKISEEWRNFDDIDKIPYKEKYDETLSEYREKMKDYKSSLTPADKRLLRSMKLDVKHNVKEFEKEFPKPKYPGNGYILFVKSHLEESPRQEHQDMKEWMRDCASRWQSLDEDRKQQFKERASPLMEKYREELKEWKEKYQVNILQSSLLHFLPPPPIPLLPFVYPAFPFLSSPDPTLRAEPIFLAHSENTLVGTRGNPPRVTNPNPN